MIVPELFLYINYTVSSIVGVPLNALLVWLIMNRSPGKMRQYRSVLLLSAFTDIVSLIDTLVVMPVVAVKDNLVAYLTLGPFSQLPNPWGFAVLMTWIFLFSFSEFSLAVPFVYRYYVIYREKKWGLGQFLAMLLVPVILSIEQIGLIYYAGYVRSVEENLAANEHFGFPIDSNKTYVLPAFAPTYILASIPSCNVAFFSGVNYFIILIFGRRLHNHLNAMAASHLSQARFRALNKQITTTLILQAVIPLVVEIVPTMEVVISIVTGVNLADSSLNMIAFVAWIPVLNPLVTMWVVRAYRREIWPVRFKLKARVPAMMPTIAGSRVAPSAPPQIVIAAIG